MLSRAGGQTLSTFHTIIVLILIFQDRTFLDNWRDQIPQENSCNYAYACSTSSSGVAKRSRRHSITIESFDFDQISLDKAIHAQLHSTRWPNALDISLYMNVER